MILSKEKYTWFYDNFQSRVYDILMKYAFLPFGGEMKCRKEMVEEINFAANGNILELCCGTGCMTRFISEKAGESNKITALDLSSGQIRKARKKLNKRKYILNAEFLQCDAAKTDFEDNSFSKVIIPFALHEMQGEDRLKVLKEAQRVLNTGGTVVVFELDKPGNAFLRFFTAFWLLYWMPFNFETPTRNDMFRQGIVNEIKEKGFSEIRKVSKFGGVFQVVEARKLS